MNAPRSFVATQREAQAEYFARHFGDDAGFGGHGYRLPPDKAILNVAEPFRETAEALFAATPPIKWHNHANHGLSSQVSCVNFLLPLADKPDLLSRWVAQVLDIEAPEMLVIEPNRAGRDWFLIFEWIGTNDYLNEGNAGGSRARGANATAADAAVKFRTADSRTHLLLIEWKYTERYGSPLRKDELGTRVSRYTEIAFAPNGPIRNDRELLLTDFFWEPFYQLLRQQMLAWHIENDPTSGIDRARVLHLSPSGNLALHAVTAPRLAQFGSDAFEVFRGLLVDPDAFVGQSIEDAFAAVAERPDADWFSYLRSRYPSLCRHPAATDPTARTMETTE